MKKLLWVASVLMLGSSSYLFPQSTTPEKEIAALRAEWTQNLHAKLLEPSLALYTSDAAFMSPDGTRIAGKDAIRGLYQKVFAQITSSIALESKQVGFSGDLAYDSGLYQETITSVADGTRQNLSGSYLMVDRREPDGKWRIVQQVWSETPPSGSSGTGTQ